ncbi:MAG: hypothetical protein Q7J25_13200 [Vicinamibacterales bacterium]|nr:hypothetical protein [Vicinamibacterales bacterium]
MTVSRYLLAGCLVVIGLFASAVWAHEQSVAPRPTPPVVLSGADVGFRMTGRRGQTPIGELVVRVDGQWQKAEFASGLKLITK